MSGLSAALLQALHAVVGDAGLIRDAERMQAYLSDWRNAYRGRAALVLRPASTEEVAAVVRLCAEAGVALVPQGGNTGLVDGGTPHGEVCVSMTRMNAVREVDPFNNSMVIEAGATLVAAQETAEKANRLFPLSLGSQGTATLGGLISTNAGGVSVLRYGMMRDLILGLEVVLPSGEIWDGLSGLRKNNTGYDLKHLFAGAEGTPRRIEIHANDATRARTLRSFADVTPSMEFNYAQKLLVLTIRNGQPDARIEIPVNAPGVIRCCDIVAR
jgi:FAD/FMN-containing dehydrogenase